MRFKFWHATASEMDYTVLLPTYNERENLPLVIELLTEAFASVGNCTWEVVVVDDSSPDGTGDVCKKLARLYANTMPIKLVTRANKEGLGTAYIAGLKQASGSFVIIMDCDLSHHVSKITHTHI